MSSLFELSNRFQQILHSDSEDITEELQWAEYDLREKMIDCVKYAKSLEADAQAIKDAVDAMNERRKKMEKRATEMREFVLLNMQLADFKSVECPYFKVTRKLNPPAVTIIDESLIPSEFKRVKTEVAIDKTAIKNAGGCDGVVISQAESLKVV